ncbi:MAG: Uma2 family endonuclease [Bacteroidetes bacterium]|nr:MAG: Uma2 family endonuclease [Bacteroidota bacterium]
MIFLKYFLFLKKNKAMKILDYNFEMIEKMPVTREQRMGLPFHLASKASILEYLELSEICEFRIEYHEGFIISFFLDSKLHNMLTHERIIMNILLEIGYFIQAHGLDWNLFASNLEIYIHDPEKPSFYKPDASVFKEDVKTKEYLNPKDNKKYDASENPNMVIEVLSKGTKNYDLKVKLEKYKKIASLEQIIFIEPQKLGIYNYEKIGENWIFSEHTDLTEVAMFLECPIALQRVYKKVEF